MIVIVTNASDATADVVERKLGAIGAECSRLNTEGLAGLSFRHTVQGGRVAQSLQIGASRIDPGTIRAIYYRRPESAKLEDWGAAGLVRWGQNELRRAWGGVLLALPAVTWINHPLRNMAASYKPEQHVRATRMGLDLPDTLITNDPMEAMQFCEALKWDVVVKPVGHGEILGDDERSDRVVFTSRVEAGDASRIQRVTDCPTLFQRAIEKECDVRATVVGNRLIAVALHSQEQEWSRVDCRRNGMTGMRYSETELPRVIEERILQLTRSYGLAFAAIDLIKDTEGRYWFLELNPNGQWAWLDEEAGTDIAGGLCDVLLSGHE